MAADFTSPLVLRETGMFRRRSSAIAKPARLPRMALCALVGLGSALTTLTGCGNQDDEAALREFRDSAAPLLSQGLQSIFSGLIEGFFAAAVPTDEAGGDTGS